MREACEKIDWFECWCCMCRFAEGSDCDASYYEDGELQQFCAYCAEPDEDYNE